MPNLEWRRWLAPLIHDDALFSGEVKAAALAIVAGFLLHVVAVRVARHLDRRGKWDVDELYFRRLKRVTRVLFPLIALLVAAPAMPSWLPPDDSIGRRVLTIAIIGGVVHLILVLLSTSEGHVKHKHSMDVADNYAARKLHTQVTVLKRVIATFVIVAAVSLALMTIPRVRDLGASLLASAGFAGLVIGLAARPMVENLIAGVQIALTQPINIDDVVIVEGEWGWVEEINTTYVVIRIWDERRLIVPFSKFLAEPFQNWTRRTARILGTVFFHTDFTVPVQVVRAELERIVRTCDKWDGRVCVLQVTDSTPTTMEMRALVSAANSPAAWDLRVYVRERMIEFLQREFPQALPRTRVQIPPEAASARELRSA